MKVLFVCTGNTCRSAMAEGLLKDLAEKNYFQIEVKSAGVFAFDGDEASKNAVLALKDMDIDIENHRSQSISKELVEDADLILTMSKSHRESLIMNYPQMADKIFLLNKYAFDEDKDIVDPFGRDIHNYEITRDQILKALKNINWE
ncbi:MAG TPA: low molecular weight protein arginine phosphatase [Tissierellaceae bacterium]|nr:low molecular weight protein arginine phosphatase [Tissierellaceae bacterium]